MNAEPLSETAPPSIVAGRPPALPRRAVLLGALAGAGALLTGCASASTSTSSAPPSPRPTPSPTPSAITAAEARLTALEKQFGGRIGVHALDTGTGATVGHRADERFLMCSTFKLLAVADILHIAATKPGLLGTVIHYKKSQLLDYAPITTKHVADGMTVSALCQAAITVSDNTAANLLVAQAGGPPAVTAFVRTLGDPLTRLDRIEPDLNSGGPGDQRDTTTPARIAADMRVLALGDAFAPAERDLLVGWLKANTTGDMSIRAGVPKGWTVADKTGSGAHGEINDVAVVWPPGRAPLVVAIYTAPDNPKSTKGYPTVAAAARIAVQALVPSA